MKIAVVNLSNHNGGNPDITLLYGAMSRSAVVELRPYTPRLALSGWPDVIHVNWPEWMMRRHGSRLSMGLSSRIALTVLRLARRRGAKIAWTAHNVVPHEADAHGVTRRHLRGFANCVDLVVCPAQSVVDQILHEYPVLATVPRTVIPGGLYTGHYPDDGGTREAARRRLGLPDGVRIVLAFGMVRHYKNLGRIVECHEIVQARRPEAFLLVAGKPMPASLGAQITGRGSSVPNLRLDLDEIPSSRVQDYFRAADCTLIGTSLAVNSGVALLSLSFGCPVVMPARGSAYELADAAGRDWVQLYDGGVRPAVYEAAMDAGRPAGLPDLGCEYSWDRAADLLLRRFEEIGER